LAPKTFMSAFRVFQELEEDMATVREEMRYLAKLYHAKKKELARLQKEKEDLKPDSCEGCEYQSASQKHHTCLFFPMEAQ